MRRQTATGGIIPAGSSRVSRLDPLSLPTRFETCDSRADGGVRLVDISRETVIVRRTVRDMRMTIKLRIPDFLGVALRTVQGAPTLMLKHRDPSLSIPLSIATDDEDLFDACRSWSETFALPLLLDDGRSSEREPAPRRRRRNAVKARRPSILMRRRCGGDIALMPTHRDEHEIIARS